MPRGNPHRNTRPGTRIRRRGGRAEWRGRRPYRRERWTRGLRALTPDLRVPLLLEQARALSRDLPTLSRGIADHHQQFGTLAT